MGKDIRFPVLFIKASLETNPHVSFPGIWRN